MHGHTVMGEPAAKKSRVHFGSLEEQERKRLEQEKLNGDDKSGVSAAVLAGIKAGNINVASKGAHYLEVTPKQRMCVCVRVFSFEFICVGRPSNENKTALGSKNYASEIS